MSSRSCDRPTLASLVRSGELQTLYAKWFMSPIPPKNVNLSFPMTQALKDALAKSERQGHLGPTVDRCITARRRGAC